MKPDELKRKAQELKHTTVGRVLFEYIQYKKGEVVAQITLAREPVDLFRLQGRAQELDDLLKLLNPENT